MNPREAQREFTLALQALRLLHPNVSEVELTDFYAMDNMYRPITHRDIIRYQQAIAVSYTSDIRFPMGSVIYSGRKLISAACNILKTHPDHTKRYGKHVISIHAEHRAILRARGNTTGATLYIARHTGTGDSRPCAGCMWYLRESGIRYVVFSEKGKLWKLKV